MQAVAIEQYGGPEVLKLMQLPAPKVGPDFVLIKARAAGVNPVDAKIRAGNLDGRFHAHFPLIPGWDVAGIVEDTGPDVTEFKPGDEVLAYTRRDEIQWGTYAELVAAPVRTVARKPPGLGWTEAAALPLAGLTAWQAFSRGTQVHEADIVLIHAAAGGVGSFAVQLAKNAGARVIGTGSQSSRDYVQSLGAEPVAYGEGLRDAVRAIAPQGVSVVLDTMGGATLQESGDLLSPGGRVVSIRDPEGAGKLGGRYVFVRPDGQALGYLAQLAVDGKLSVPVQQRFPLHDAAEAHRVLEEGHVHGKLALDIADA